MSEDIGSQLNLFESSGITIIKPEAEYIDTSLDPPPYSVYRIDGNLKRYYYTLIDGKPVFYISVTSLISATRPTPFALKKMLADLGWQGYHDFMKERADYGTWMHIMWNKLLVYKELPLDSEYMNMALDEYVGVHNVKIYKDSWIQDMQRDILSFAQWLKDYDVKPLLIEQPLVHPDMFAGCPDLVCELTVQEEGYWGEVYKSAEKKGKEKLTKKDVRVIAIVDYKSGKSGFFEDYELQLRGYDRLVKVNYPKLNITKLFDLAPKAWRDKPTYSFKDQTNTEIQKQFPKLLEIFKMNEDNLKPPNITKYEGTVKVGSAVDAVFEEISIEDVVKEIKNIKDN